MEFRTEIDIAPWSEPIGYDTHIVCLGSCFASNIAQRLQRHKFHVVDSPTGILFNPASIARAVDMMMRATQGDKYLERKKKNSVKYEEVPDVKFSRTYVCEDMTKCLCFYDAPDEAAVKRAREAVQTPITSLTELAD